MKKMIHTAGIALAMFAGAAMAQANEIKPYVGVGVGGFVLTSTSSSHLSYHGMVGADIGDLFGLELRYGQITESNYNVNASATGKIKGSYFTYLAKLRGNSGDLEFFGAIGGTSAKVKARITTPGWVYAASGTNTLDTTETSFSGGVGMDYKVQDHLKVGIEYMHYFKDANGYSAHIKYAF